MRQLRYIIIEILVLSLSSILHSQVKPQLAFRHYDTRNGLPSTQVQGIFEDSNGYIWTITDRGAAKFDGYQFKTYTTHHGFPTNNILLINEDNKGRLWFMCNNGEYCYLEGDSIFPYNGNPMIKKLLKDKLPGPFYFDDHDTLWITTFSGIQLFKCHGDSVKEFIPNVSEGVTPTYYLRRVGEKLITLQVGNITNDNQIYTNDNISYLLSVAGECKLACSVQVAENRWAVAGPGGYVVFDESGNLKAFFESSPYIFSTLEHDRSGNLWLTNSNGAYRLHNYNSGPSDADAFFEGHFITSVIQDRYGNYWFGDRDNGLFFVPSIDISVYSSGTSDKQDKIVSLKVVGDQLNYSDASGSIYVVQEKEAVKINKEYVPSGVSLDFVNTAKGNYITGNKPFLFQIKNGEFKLLDETVTIRKSISLKDGKCAFALADGLAFLDNAEKWTRIEKSIFSERCNILYETDTGTLWIGANGGLFKYDHGIITPIEAINEKKPRISDIISWKDYLVCSTKASGLIFYKKGEVYELSEKHGIISDMIDCITTDGESIWIGTASGIQQLNIEELSQGRFASFLINYQKGLPSNEVNDILFWKDKLHIATNDGYCSLDPFVETLKGQTTEVKITGVSVNGLEIQNDSLQFPWNQNNVRVNFISLYFRTADKTNYRYKLSGLFDFWIETTTQYADFPALSAGTYHFIVEAKNEDGQWGNSATIKFEILPHFTNTWWFRIMVIAFIVLILYLAFYLIYRNKKLKYENRVKMSELRQQALNANMNPHFIFNALGSIQHFINSGKSDEANEYLADFSKLIRMNLETNQQARVSLEDELERLELYLKLEHLRFEEKLQYEIRRAPVINTFDLEIPPMLLQPYVENALLHGILPSGRNGILTIEINPGDTGSYTIEIRDNGIGLTAALKNKPIGHRSLALKMNDERLTILTAQTGKIHRAIIMEMHTASGLSSGTRVLLVLPS